MRQRPGLRLFVVSDRMDKVVPYRSQLEFVERVKAHNLPITHVIATATDKNSHGLFAHGHRLVVDCAEVDREAARASGSGVVQRVVLYEEDDPVEPRGGKQYVGSVIWRTEPIKANGNQKPDIAVRADIVIPDRMFKMTMSFRRSTNTSLPDSHTVELTFVLPQEFSGGGVGNVPGILMKSNQQARGTPLAGLAMKVMNGFFLVGLSNVDSDRARNLQLLKEHSWFDVPLVYANQRRAIIAIEKGAPGERAFNAAFAAWESESPSTGAPSTTNEAVQATKETTYSGVAEAFKKALSYAPVASAPVASSNALSKETKTPDSGYLVQVSSQKNEADAQASYRALQSKFPSVLGSRPPVIKRVDLGDNGVYYRAMVGPFGSPDEASQFCGSLKTAGGQCVVQRN